MTLVYESDGRILGKIEDGGAAGFYLFIFDPVSGRCTHDHIQDTLEIALEQAEEDYSLSKGNWRPQGPCNTRQI